MAKQKPNRAKKVAKNAPSQGAKSRKAKLNSTIGRLDAAAAQFARLLSDPCTGSLCHPVYSGSDVGYLGRFETDFLASTLTASTTSGALLFAPGCIGNNAVDVHTPIGNNAVMKLGNNVDVVTDAGLFPWRTAQPTTQPGYNFFNTGSDAVRPVAACLQIHYTGTELNRAGTVSLARVNAGGVLSGDTTSVALVRSASQYVDRTPNSHYEIIWTPSDGDQLMTDPSQNTLQRQAERKNAVLLTFSGIDPAFLRIRLVCVYEWVPEVAQGLIVDSTTRNKSFNTLDHVLNALDGAGRWWIKNGSTIGALYKSGAMLLGGM